MNLKDKVVLITGAGSGLGKALALAAGQVGAKVICAGRRTDKIQQTSDEVTKVGGVGTAMEMDKTSIPFLANRLWLPRVRRSKPHLWR